MRSLLFIIHDPGRASMGEWRHWKHPYGVGRRVIGSAPSVSVKRKHVARRLCGTTRLLHNHNDAQERPDDHYSKRHQCHAGNLNHDRWRGCSCAEVRPMNACASYFAHPGYFESVTRRTITLYTPQAVTRDACTVFVDQIHCVLSASTPVLYPSHYLAALYQACYHAS